MAASAGWRGGSWSNREVSRVQPGGSARTVAMTLLPCRIAVAIGDTKESRGAGANESQT